MRPNGDFGSDWGRCSQLATYRGKCALLTIMLGSLAVGLVSTATADSLTPSRSDDPVQAVKAAVGEHPYAKLAIKDAFARYLNLAGPKRRDMEDVLLVRKTELLPILWEALRNGSDDQRFNALLFLQQVGPWREVAAQIAPLAKDDKLAVPVRIRAIGAGAVLQLKEVTPVAAQLLADSPSEEMRTVCARALAVLQARQFIPQLETALQDASPRVRIMAAESLGRLGSTAGLNELLDRSREQDWALRMLAADGLGYLDDSQARQRLSELEQDTVVDVRGSASVAIQRIAIRALPVEQRPQALIKLLESDRRIARFALLELVEKHPAKALETFKSKDLKCHPLLERPLQTALLQLSEGGAQ